MKRSRPKPRSAKRMATDGERRAIREAVFARDRGCVLRRLEPTHRCFGGLTPHHLQKASAGGAYSMENLVAVCAGGNDWLETEPARARELGLVRSAWE